MEKMSILIVFNGIYYYSSYQLILVKTKIYINDWIEFFNLEIIKNYIRDFIIYDEYLYDLYGETSEKTDNLIYAIKNGNILEILSLQNGSLKTVLQESEIDFFIYNSLHDIGYNILLKKIDDNLSYEFGKTSYKFLQVEIILEKKSFLVSFSNDKYNFYIINNFINRSFILYFLKTYYKDLIVDCSDEYLSNYKIKIIDQSINLIELVNTDELVFEKNTYVLKSNELLCQKEKEKPLDILEDARNRKITSSIIFNVKEEDEIEEEYINIVN
jgi:hypothetical protein